MRRSTLLFVLAAALAACAGAPTRQAPEAASSAAGGAPSVSVGGTMRGLYGYAK